MKEQMNPANRLIHETSPYLLQHAYNPVDWYPWGEEGLQKAKAEDKPIFLSIGYSACHWCHIMEKESFTDERVARFLNQNFVPIKVDREERPDLDSIYMNAVVLMTGQGGWPTSLFLTPALEPFFGGTYFPPVPRNGMIAFLDLIKAIHQAWQQDREHIFSTAKQITERLVSDTRSGKNNDQMPRTDLVDAVRDELLDAYDWQYGGWGRAPKFPQPMLLDFFCMQASRGHETALRLVVHALEAMSRGGMHDLIGGGFHRYSTDAHWLAPHFEKMLYDNAQLALVYLHAYLLTSNSEFQQICTEILDFILREMTDPLGGFYSSLDADSQGEEGKFYLWTETELKTLLTADQHNLLKTAYPYPPEGNFEGQIIFQRTSSLDLIARQFNLTVDDLSTRLDDLRLELLQARNARTRPATDKKVLTGWNGFTLRAFAEAGRYLNRPDYIEVAQKNANFLLTSLWTTEGLRRSWNNGQARFPAYLEDYGSLILGLIALYQADFDVRWFSSACLLRDEMIKRFTDPAGGFFDAQAQSGDLLFRPKELQDSATPSGNALAASSLLILDAYSGETNHNLEIARFIGGFQSTLVQYPTSFGYWLQVLDFMKGPVHQIALISPNLPLATEELGNYLSRKYLPSSVFAASGLPISADAPVLLRDRPPINNLPTVYVCQDFFCHLPVTDLRELIAQLP